MRHALLEGVETQGQLAFLQAQRCAEGQGYLFSRPLAAAQLAYLLQTSLTETVLR
jgi:EAL domain-containing protein (putative c-di-GMP-specific phosphodiesterase class I)